MMIYYKYLPSERVDVLENLKIRYTQASALNDPFESFLGIINEDRDWYFKRFIAEIKNEIKKLGIKGESKKKQYFRRRKKEFQDWYKFYSNENMLEKNQQKSKIWFLPSRAF